MGSVTKDLQNLCDENLDNYATISGLANVVVGGSPVISIKDNQNCYASGTVAGFVICENSNAKVLSLGLAEYYKIQFMKDGKAVGDLRPISSGNSITGLGLSLLTFPGSDQVNQLYVATAPGDFDEIKLVQIKLLSAEVGNSINFKYAFVGDAREYTITNNDNGITKYAKEQGRENAFTLEAHGDGPTKAWGEASRGDVIDANLTNGYAAVVGALVPISTPVTVVAKPSDGKEAFPKGR